MIAISSKKLLFSFLVPVLSFPSTAGEATVAPQDEAEFGRFNDDSSDLVNKEDDLHIMEAGEYDGADIMLAEFHEMMDRELMANQMSILLGGHVMSMSLLYTVPSHSHSAKPQAGSPSVNTDLSSAPSITHLPDVPPIITDSTIVPSNITNKPDAPSVITDTHTAPSIITVAHGTPSITTDTTGAPSITTNIPLKLNESTAPLTPTNLTSPTILDNLATPTPTTPLPTIPMTTMTPTTPTSPTVYSSPTPAPVPTALATHTVSSLPTALTVGSHTPNASATPTTHNMPTSPTINIPTSEASLSTRGPSTGSSTTLPTVVTSTTLIPSIPLTSAPSAVLSTSPSQYPSPMASMNPSTNPSANPSINLSINFSAVPSVIHSTTHSSVPSSAPSLVSSVEFPERAPVPATLSVITRSPNATYSPSQGLLPMSIFRCNESAFLEITEPLPRTSSTIVTLQVGYLVEATAEPELWMAVLDMLIFVNAVMASTECSSIAVPSPLFRPMETFTNITGPCVATNENATCFLMETDLSYILDGATDAETAAFLAYSSLQDDMRTFASSVRSIENVQYLSPIPIPDAGGSFQTTPSPSTPPGLSILNSDKTPLSVSKWTIGACVAMSTGGLMALMVWARNRRTRHRRHVQLLEDISMEPSVHHQPQRELVTHA